MHRHIWFPFAVWIALSGCSPANVGQVTAAPTVLVGTTTFAVSANAQSVTPAQAAEGDQILFDSVRHQAPYSPTVYVAAPDGSKLRQIAVGLMPAWSPDGRQIAYVGGDGNIFVTSLEVNSTPWQLTFGLGASNVSHPLWSPDGRHIVFGVNPTLSPSISIVDVPPETSPPGPGAVRQISHPTTWAFSPSWSPDSERIAYSLSGGENDPAGIAVSNVNAPADQVTWLTTPATGYCPVQCPTDSSPVWSPDGQKIAFTSTREGRAEIYTMNVDGSGVTRFTALNATNQGPVWSPDGQRIAFWSERDGNREIYVMGRDGTPQTRVTNNPGMDQDPAWSPDGKRLAFSSNRNGNFDIYVCNVDGTGLVRVTDDPGDELNPTWRPVP